MNTYTITFYSKHVGKKTEQVNARTALRAKHKLEKVYGKIHTLKIK